MKEKRNGEDDGGEKRTERTACGEQEIEERGFRGTPRTKGIRLAMTEEAGDEELNEKEENADAHGQRDVDLGKHVAEASKHDGEKTHDNAARQQARKLEGDDDGEQIDGKRKNPEERDGSDVGGEVAGDGG